MKFWIVTDNMGDGDVFLRFFKCEANARIYMEAFPDACSDKVNPRYINTKEIEFEEDIK